MKPKAITLMYVVITIAVITLCLTEMRLYLNAPSVQSKVWNAAARDVRKGWKSGDTISFHPTWISGFMMGKRRFVGLALPSEGISLNDAEGRFWFVSLYASQRLVDRVDRDFRSELTKQHGPVRVQLLSPLPESPGPDITKP